GRF
ncbi:sodium/hydrogen exchanger family protein, partial [Vibrio parahaemolyticus V-223/04]